MNKEEMRNKFLEEHPKIAQRIDRELQIENERFLRKQGKLSREHNLHKIYYEDRLIYQQKKEESAQRMFQMKKDGSSLYEIGDAQKPRISAERVRQVISKFPGYKETKVRSKAIYIETPCHYDKCTKIIRTPMGSSPKKWCSPECRMTDCLVPHTIPVRKMTKDQWREYNNKKVKGYYHRHRDDPRQKERTKRYNKNQSENRKRWYENLSEEKKQDMKKKREERMKKRYEWIKANNPVQYQEILKNGRMRYRDRKLKNNENLS